MSELTYKELCDHEYVQAYIAELRDDYNAELKKHGELEAENAQLKAECEQWKVVDKKKLHNKITKLEKERDGLLSNLESCKGNELANEVAQLKAELAQCQQAAKFGCCEICGATSWTQSKTEGPHTTRMVAGGVTTYWRCDRCWLKQQLHEATQREARLVSLLKRSRDVLQWDGAAYTILQEDIAEELTEEAGT